MTYALVAGVLFGLYFSLVGIGLNLVFGVMRIVNLAHGNIYAIGAFVTAWAIGLAVAADWPNAVMFVLLPVGAFAAAAVGAVIEVTFLRPIYKRPGDEYQLLMTFGLLMILEDLIRLIWGPNPLTATSIYATLGSLSIADARYPTYNVLIIIIGAVAALFLWAFIYRTKFGVLLRATSQDKRMASALGINVNRIYVQAFTLGCFMAGLGGAIVVPSQSAVLGMGVDALVLSFIVVVIGGLGSLEGALAGALIVGVVRETGITLFPEIELAVLYLIAAVVLLVRPAGIFGRA